MAVTIAPSAINEIFDASGSRFGLIDMSTAMIFRGKTPTGFSITFGEPMSKASVENVHNYAITTGTTGNPILDAATWLLTQATQTEVSVPLKAAHYDAKTDTVTLIPSNPLKSSVLYGISTATPLATHQLTNVQGVPLHGASFGLRGHRSVTWPGGKPSTVVYGG
jgi:hypothetical protein